MKLITYLQQTHGLARRTITDLIQRRELILNGTVVDNFLVQVESGDNYIATTLRISGTVSIHPVDTHIILFYKPVGYTVSKSDPHNDTIYDILPDGWNTTYYPIGRLDKDSCGLLLLTNNTALVHQFSHPRYEHHKIYHVLLKQQRNESHTSLVLGGVRVKDEKSGSVITLSCDTLTRIPGGVAITLHEGKNRHIRKMLGTLGYEITELKRVSFAQRTLGSMREGEYRILQYMR